MILLKVHYFVMRVVIYSILLCYQSRNGDTFNGALFCYESSNIQCTTCILLWHGYTVTYDIC